MVTTQTHADAQATINAWFQEMINHLKVDQLLMATDTASQPTRDFYNRFIFGNARDAVHHTRQNSNQFFIIKILTDYITTLNKARRIPRRLALGISDSRLLVWAEIEDNDEATEDALLLSEAEVNATYYENGFCINSTIVEKSDLIPIPPHYLLIKS